MDVDPEPQSGTEIDSESESISQSESDAQNSLPSRPRAPTQDEIMDGILKRYPPEEDQDLVFDQSTSDGYMSEEGFREWQQGMEEKRIHDEKLRRRNQMTNTDRKQRNKSQREKEKGHRERYERHVAENKRRRTEGAKTVPPQTPPSSLCQTSSTAISEGGSSIQLPTSSATSHRSSPATKCQSSVPPSQPRLTLHLSRTPSSPPVSVLPAKSSESRRLFSTAQTQSIPNWQTETSGAENLGISSTATHEAASNHPAGPSEVAQPLSTTETEQRSPTPSTRAPGTIRVHHHGKASSVLHQYTSPRQNTSAAQIRKSSTPPVRASEILRAHMDLKAKEASTAQARKSFTPQVRAFEIIRANAASQLEETSTLPPLPSTDRVALTSQNRIPSTLPPRPPQIPPKAKARNKKRPKSRAFSINQPHSSTLDPSEGSRAIPSFTDATLNSQLTPIFSPFGSTTGPFYALPTNQNQGMHPNIPQARYPGGSSAFQYTSCEPVTRKSSEACFSSQENTRQLNLGTSDFPSTLRGSNLVSHPGANVAQGQEFSSFAPSQMNTTPAHGFDEFLPQEMKNATYQSPYDAQIPSELSTDFLGGEAGPIVPYHFPNQDNHFSSEHTATNLFHRFVYSQPQESGTNLPQRSSSITPEAALNDPLYDSGEISTRGLARDQSRGAISHPDPGTNPVPPDTFHDANYMVVWPCPNMSAPDSETGMWIWTPPLIPGTLPANADPSPKIQEETQLDWPL